MNSLPNLSITQESDQNNVIEVCGTRLHASPDGNPTYVGTDQIKENINSLVEDQVTSFLEAPFAGIELNVTIESVFDPMCPWCFIGLRRMQAALADAHNVRAHIVYVPFVFDPDTPVPPLPWYKYVALRYPDRAERIYRDKLPLTLAEAESCGIRMHDYYNRPLGPTVDALRLLKICMSNHACCHASPLFVQHSLVF